MFHTPFPRLPSPRDVRGQYPLKASKTSEEVHRQSEPAWSKRDWRSDDESQGIYLRELGSPFFARGRTYCPVLVFIPRISLWVSHCVFLFFFSLWPSFLDSVFYPWFEPFPLVFVDIYHFNLGLSRLPYVAFVESGTITYAFYCLYLFIGPSLLSLQRYTSLGFSWLFRVFDVSVYFVFEVYRVGVGE